MDDFDVCPLCTDPLDATDKAINYCQCGYKMCLWCWNQLMETAGKENLPGKCPNCRTEYDKEKITMAQLDPEELHKEQQKGAYVPKCYVAPCTVCTPAQLQSQWSAPAAWLACRW
jgi:hypothetical protein